MQIVNGFQSLPVVLASLLLKADTVSKKKKDDKTLVRLYFSGKSYDSPPIGISVCNFLSVFLKKGFVCLFFFKFSTMFSLAISG